MPKPFSVECPNCEARLKIQNPKAIGKKVRCPNCENPFTVKGPRSKPPRDEFDDYEDDFGGVSDDYEDDYDAPPSRSKRGPARSARGGRPSRATKSRGKGRKKKKSSGGHSKIAIYAGVGVAVLFLLGIGFFLFSGGGSDANFAWLPPDSQAVISVDVDAVWNADITQRAIKEQDGNPLDRLQSELKNMGFKDGETLDAIDSVNIGMIDPDRNEGLAVFRKKTAWDIEGFKSGQNPQEETKDGKTYYTKFRDAYYFPDDNTLLVGPKEMIEAAISRGPDNNLDGKFGFMPSGHISMGFLPQNAGDIQEKAQLPPMAQGVLGGKDYFQNIMDGMQSLNGGGLGITLGGGMEFEILAKCSNSEMAGKLSDGLNAGLDDLQTFYDENKGMIPQDFAGPADDLLASLSASQSGDSVTVTVEIPKSTIDTFEDFSKKQGGGGGGLPFDLDDLMPNFGGMGGGRNNGPPPGFGPPPNAGGNPIANAREAAQRAESKNNLKQIAIAMHNYHDVYGSFPIAKDAEGSQLSWRVHLLPYLEYGPLYEQFHLNEPWDSPHNRSLIAQMPDVFKRPNSRAPRGKTTYLSLSGPRGIMENPQQPKRFRDVTDGLSNTLMVVEVEDSAAVDWTKPEDLKFDTNNPHRSLGGWPGGFHGVLGDGAVRFISNTIDTDTLRNLMQSNDGNIIGQF